METKEINKPYVIGLDLGGTNSVFGIVDSRGEIKATTAIKTQGYDKVEDFQKRFPKSELKESVDWLVENIKSDGKLADDLMKKIESEE